MEPERLLETVLFADIVGSTERAAELGDRAWRGLLRDFFGVVHRELRRFRGREISTSGDAFLAIFDRPARALDCACAIRDAVHALGLEVRTGLHAGEVEVAGKDVGGIAVHIGARVAAVARPGEVLVSSTVRDLVTGSGFGFEDRGAQVLKGVPEEWHLYAVAPRSVRAAVPGLLKDLGESLQSARLPRLTRRGKILVSGVVVSVLAVLAALYVSRRDRISGFVPGVGVAEAAAPGIAVLPFSVSGADLDEWREGLVDLLSTDLDGVADLRAIDSRTVIARWNERVPEGLAPDLAVTLEAARLTGARYALVGSAVALGPDVRLVAEIHDLQSGASLGKVQVTGRSEAMLELVDRLSVEVLRKILPGEQDESSWVDLATVTTGSRAALEAFLEGERLFRHSEFEQAIAAYQRAVDADSSFAFALYRLATIYRLGQPFDPDLAKQYLERAARLANRLPERQRLFADATLDLERDPRKGIGSLRTASSKYPEDAEAWYQLGKACEDWGAEALLEWEDCDRAYARVVELDPSFTPAYGRLIHHAFTYHPDSARAAQLIEAYGLLVRGSEADRVYRLVFALAFGDSVAQVGARAALDTLPQAAWQVSDYLTHPRFLSLQEEVLRAPLASSGPRERPLFSIALFYNNFSQGKLLEALAHIESWSAAMGKAWTVRWQEPVFYVAFARGMPVSREQLDRELAWKAEGAPPSGSFFRGAYAADRGRWADHRAAVARLRRDARDFRAAGDSTGGRFVEGLALALEGYAQWKRDEPDEARRLLESAQAQASGASPHESPFKGGPFDANAVIRFWLGRIALENGSASDAERYFATFWPNPLAAYYLGKAYEELKEYGKAREAYEAFAEGWRDADPELQPLVFEGRRAAARLASAIRE